MIVARDFCSSVEIASSSIRDALDANGLNPEIAPTWIPDGYELVDLIIEKNPMQETYVAIYSADNSRLKITVQSFISSRPEQIEMSDDFFDIYPSSGTDYYLFTNVNHNRAAWLTDSYECYISGDLSIEELTLMIDSIGKG